MVEFEETEACAACEILEECRKAKEPRRVSCWIHACRKHWAGMLGQEKADRKEEHSDDCEDGGAGRGTGSLP